MQSSRRGRQTVHASHAGNLANSWQLVLTNYHPSYPLTSFLPYGLLYAAGDVSIPDHVSSFGSIQVCHDVGNKDTTGVCIFVECGNIGNG